MEKQNDQFCYDCLFPSTLIRREGEARQLQFFFAVDFRLQDWDVARGVSTKWRYSKESCYHAQESGGRWISEEDWIWQRYHNLFDQSWRHSSLDKPRDIFPKTQTKVKKKNYFCSHLVFQFFHFGIALKSYFTFLKS